jgi:hypothetical protein
VLRTDQQPYSGRRRPVRYRFRRASASRMAGLALVIAAFLLLGSFSVGGVLAAMAHGSPAAANQGQDLCVVVAAGDTLWGIASSHAPRDMDLRYAVYALRQHNQLASANIHVGQRIALPRGWRGH